MKFFVSILVSIFFLSSMAKALEVTNRIDSFSCRLNDGDGGDSYAKLVVTPGNPRLVLEIRYVCGFVKDCIRTFPVQSIDYHEMAQIYTASLKDNNQKIGEFTIYPHKPSGILGLPTGMINFKNGFQRSGYNCKVQGRF